MDLQYNEINELAGPSTEFFSQEHESSNTSRKRKNVPMNIKSEVNRLMKSYAFMYDKSHKFYRNQNKRDAVWHSIATQLKITVPEVKTAWKSIKDSHRLRVRKNKISGKSGDAAPDDIDDLNEEMDDDELDFTYLDQQDTSLYRETVSLGGGTTFSAPESIDLTTNNFQTPKSSQTTSSYSYMDKNKRHTRNNTVLLDTMETISKNMTTLISQENSDSKLKRHDMWAGLENMMQYLDEDSIIDLNASFINQIHAVILAKRAKDTQATNQIQKQLIQ